MPMFSLPTLFTPLAGLPLAWLLFAQLPLQPTPSQAAPISPTTPVTPTRAAAPERRLADESSADETTPEKSILEQGSIEQSAANSEITTLAQAPVSGGSFGQDLTPRPITPQPVTPSPITPSPITPSPITPSPITSQPFTPTQLGAEEKSAEGTPTSTFQPSLQAPSLTQPTIAQPTIAQPLAPQTRATLNSTVGEAASLVPRIDGATPTMNPVRQSTPSLAEQILSPAILNDHDSISDSDISLLESLENASEREMQHTIVKAYWQLSLAQADANFAMDEVSVLSRLQATGKVDQSLLVAANEAAIARDLETQLALAAAQHDFSEAIGRRVVDPNFAPSNLPYVGVYRTNFGSLFAGREPPAGLLRIERTLPHFHRLIEGRARAVAASMEALAETQSAYSQRQASLSEVLQAHQQMRDQRLALLRSVGDYNYTIADFALSVASQGVSREVVVAMLIEVPRPLHLNPVNSTNPTLTQNAIRQVQAVEPIPQVVQPTVQPILQATLPQTLQPGAALNSQTIGEPTDATSRQPTPATPPELGSNPIGNTPIGSTPQPINAPGNFGGGSFQLQPSGGTNP